MKRNVAHLAMLTALLFSCSCLCSCSSLETENAKEPDQTSPEIKPKAIVEVKPKAIVKAREVIPDPKEIRFDVPVRIGDVIPDWSAKDTNPSSPTFGKNLSTRDFKGAASVWIIAFDSDC